jgi:hypothetical protein
MVIGWENCRRVERGLMRADCFLTGQRFSLPESLLRKAVWNRIRRLRGKEVLTSPNILCSRAPLSVMAVEVEKPIKVLIFEPLSGTLKYRQAEIYHPLNNRDPCCTAEAPREHPLRDGGSEERRATRYVFDSLTLRSSTSQVPICSRARGERSVIAREQGRVVAKDVRPVRGHQLAGWQRCCRPCRALQL